MSQVEKPIIFRLIKRCYLLLLGGLGEVFLVLGIFRMFLLKNRGSFVLLYHYPRKDILQSHIKFFKKFFNIVDSDAIFDWEGRQLNSSRLCITFDDGYKYIYEVLYGELQKEGIPFTIFISTRNIENREPFWWDIYEAKEKLTKIKFRNLKDMKSEQRIKFLEISDNKKNYIDLINKFPLEWEDIRKMLDSGFMRVGDHGYTHISFNNLSEEEIEKDLIKSRRLIREKLGIEVKTFSYPHGEFSIGIKKILKRLGYQSAFTTLPGVNRPCTDSFFLRRIEADNSNRGVLVLKLMGIYYLLTGFRLEKYLIRRGIPLKELHLMEGTLK